jgi:hypothetical protein
MAKFRGSTERDLVLTEQFDREQEGGVLREMGIVEVSGFQKCRR